MAITLATDLKRYGNLSSAAGDRTHLERLAGWLGEATLINPGDNGISFGADDFIADLDAANIAHIMRNNPNLSLADATNLYFSKVDSGRTRAEMFLEHTPLKEVVIPEILKGLGLYHHPPTPSRVPSMSQEELADYQMSELHRVAPDSYDFIGSLREGLHEMGSFAR